MVRIYIEKKCRYFKVSEKNIRRHINHIPSLEYG